MIQKFHAAIHQKGGITYLKLAGVIDEDNELFDLLDQIGPGTVVINLAELERINSCGVRDWVNWLGRIEKKGAKVVLVECSPAIVAQINLVSNFTGNGVVKSFYAPYFCPSCNLEKVLLIEMEEMKAMDHPKAPVCRCDECDGIMDFDDMEESYFAFVATAKEPVVDAEVEQAVSELATEEAGEEASSGGRKVRTRGSGSFAGAGTGSAVSRAGSQVSSVSLPSLPSVPSLPSLPSLANLEQSNPELVARLQESQPKAPARRASTKTNLVLVVIVILLVMAIALLLYVIFVGPSGGQKAGGGGASALPGLLMAFHKGRGNS